MKYRRSSVVVSAMVLTWLGSALSSAAFASAHHMFEEEAVRAGVAYGDEKGEWRASNAPASWNFRSIAAAAVVGASSANGVARQRSISSISRHFR